MFRHLSVAFIALVAVLPLAARAAGSANAVSVVAVKATPVADIVLLGAGFDRGLRQGMVCRVDRAGVEIAEVLLVELRPASSAALIVTLATGQSIRPGDLARLKILKT